MFVELLRGALAPPLTERSLVRMWFPYLLCEEPILWLFSRIFFHMFSSPGSKGGLTLRSSITSYFCYLVHTNLDLKIHYELFRFGCAGEWEYVRFIFLTWLQCIFITLPIIIWYVWYLPYLLWKCYHMFEVFPALHYSNSL